MTHPYLVRTRHGTVVEVPFNGAADYRHYSTFPGPMMLPPVVETVWLDELQVAAAESRAAAATDGNWTAPVGAVAAWAAEHADVTSSQEDG